MIESIEIEQETVSVTKEKDPEAWKRRMNEACARTLLAIERMGPGALVLYHEGHLAFDSEKNPDLDDVDARDSVDVIEDTPELLVLDVRYKYQDRLRDDEDSHVRLPGGVAASRKVCRGFESRQFTLEKVDGDVQVVDMTGPVRGSGARVGNVTLDGSLGVGLGSRIDGSTCRTLRPPFVAAPDRPEVAFEEASSADVDPHLLLSMIEPVGPSGPAFSRLRRRRAA
jgi:hypothetical protein